MKILALLLILIFIAKNCKRIRKIPGYNNIYYTNYKAPLLIWNTLYLGNWVTLQEKWEFHNRQDWQRCLQSLFVSG